ncbi:MAG: DoxX family membrane protein [Algicola sp.]|nr:DoxX family membrane protein [Algicola sp.]
MLQQFSSKINARILGLTLVRINIGVMFLIAAYAKLIAGDGWPGRMVGFLNFQAEKSFGFYRDFITSVVVPNKEAFGYMVAYGELFVGLSLLLGLTTRWGAMVGVFLVSNFIMAKGVFFWTPSSNDAMYILALLALLFVNNKDMLGLDNLAVKKWPILTKVWI